MIPIIYRWFSTIIIHYSNQLSRLFSMVSIDDWQLLLLMPGNHALERLRKFLTASCGSILRAWWGCLVGIFMGFSWDFHGISCDLMGTERDISWKYSDLIWFNGIARLIFPEPTTISKIALWLYQQTWGIESSKRKVSWEVHMIPHIFRGK